MVVLLIDNLNLITCGNEFEQGNSIIRHKLSGNGATDQLGVLFSAACNVLMSLDYSMLIGPSLSLNRHHELTTMFINSNINLVDFYLAYAFDGGPKMILQRIGGNA